jgi:DNA-binding NarL/FixJ family response regulator
MAIETPYSKLSALVIDDAPVQLATLRGQLAMLGIQKVDGATNPDEALRLARAGKHSLVLCDFSLGHRTDGQQLFEYMRENELIAPDCLFFMVTAENGYSSVAAASEHKPDAYLLKPITASDLEDRLKAGLERRKVFLTFLAEQARKNLQGALDACDAILARKDRWYMQALQQKAQVLLQLARHADARAAYQTALDLRPQLAWAQLGLARALKAGGQLEEARRIAQDMLASSDGERNLGAYDLLAEVLDAQGDSRGAQWVLRDAAAAVPSAKRHRLLAQCALRNGDLEVGLESLAKVTKATQGAITAQAQDSLSMAQAMVDAGRAGESITVLEKGLAGQAKAPAVDSVAQAIRAQALARMGDAAGAAAAMARARESLRSGRADFAAVALAKAELLAGNPEVGLDMLSKVVSSDHESPHVRQLVSNALRSTGHEEKVATLVEGAATRMQQRLTDAKTLLRESQVDEAVATIESTLKDYPENTGVLLQAAQINCMSLRLKKQLNAAVVDRVQVYLTRLDRLLPNSDRVRQMRLYLRETQAALAATAVA